jgi:fluoride exporter
MSAADEPSLARAALLVFVGGGSGSVLRLVVSRLWASTGPAFPWATLTVNLLGALAIGVLGELAASRGLSRSMALTLGTGLLGGFTTFSAFALETVRLAETRPSWAVSYVTVTLLAGLVAAIAGAAAVRAL